MTVIEQAKQLLGLRARAEGVSLMVLAAAILLDGIWFDGIALQTFCAVLLGLRGLVKVVG